MKSSLKGKGKWGQEKPKENQLHCLRILQTRLKRVAERESVIIEEIKPNRTSQIYPRCGYASKKNWKGYSYFRCMKCSYEADRDRAASSTSPSRRL